ncbi:MAG: FISUMP domain-containing protein [Bacteroidota bacterium]
MKNFLQLFISLIVLLTIMNAQTKFTKAQSGYSSTASLTVKVYTARNLTPVKNFAAALYDSSGSRIDSLVAQDTNGVKFIGVPVTGVRSTGELPTEYFLEQNYPNPFNPSTRIQFTVPHAGPVSLKTYTILGQEDASLELMLEPGSYEAQYTPGGAAGVVFYRLITKDFTETKKMIQFGGEKTGKSKLTLVSSGIPSRSQRSSTILEYQANQFMVKLYNLPSTYLPIVNTTLLITGLKKDTTVSVYVEEAKGMSCPGKPTILYLGKTYNTVQIGDQCWLKENLNAGTMIIGTQEQTNNRIIEKYCYNNDPAKCDTFGGLYQWGEVMQYSSTAGIKGICPTGWHIPTYAELQILAMTVNNNGNSLKAVGQDGGTNTSGFSALLTGYRESGVGFGNIGIFASIWSSTGSYETGATNMGLNSDNSIIDFQIYKVLSLSIRCILNTQGEVNSAPSQPSNPNPDDNATSVSTYPTLTWFCTDPDNDTLTYDIYLGTDNPPTSRITSNQVDTSLTLSNLDSTKLYFWKVVARDGHGDSTIGPIWQFTTGPPHCGTPVIYAGKTYNTIQIGYQCWLKENLNVGRIIDGSQDQTNNSIIEKYCINNDTAKCTLYGGLYQWNEAMQYSVTAGAQGICPTFWHVPTSADLQILSTTVNNNGNLLKTVGQGTGAGVGSNTSGFSALLVGYRGFGGSFSFLGEYTSIWSSTTNAGGALTLGLYSYNSYIDFHNYSGVYGFSVRCLLNRFNQPPTQPSNPNPGNGATGISTSTILSWSCSDPENDTLVYDVYFGTDNPPATKISSGQTDTSLYRSGLSNGTIYYWNVIAKDNHNNSTTGNVWSFTTIGQSGAPCLETPTVAYFGKTYNTIQIGTQCWLKENLNVGTMIQGTDTSTNNGSIEKYCYNNDTANCTLYGGLYQWNEAMQYSVIAGAQGICPAGWHIPTQTDLQTLATAVKNDGNALKAVGQGTGAGAGTDTSGFSALLAGYKDLNGNFNNLGYITDFWSSSEYSAIFAYNLYLYDINSTINVSINNKGSGYNVRCIKDN